MSVLGVTDRPPVWAAVCFQMGNELVKSAGEPEIAYNLAGRLQLSSTGFLVLSVPNAFVRGAFAAMAEPGVELPPPGPDGNLNAHVTVMQPDEVTLAGGADAISERGKQFHYTLGRVYSVEPDGWPEMAKVWFVRVHSPELAALRRSYGLSSLPGDGKHDFHITFAVRRRGVLGRNATAKGVA